AAQAISKGDFSSAAVYQERALSLISRKTDVVDLVGIYENLLPLGQRTRAIELLEALVKRRRNNVAPYVMLAQLIAKSNPERSVALIEEAREIWGSRPDFDGWLKSVNYRKFDATDGREEPI